MPDLPGTLDLSGMIGGVPPGEGGFADPAAGNLPVTTKVAIVAATTPLLPDSNVALAYSARHLISRAYMLKNKSCVRCLLPSCKLHVKSKPTTPEEFRPFRI